MDIEVVDDGSAGIPTAQQNAGTSSTTQVIGDSLWNNPLFLRYWKIQKQLKCSCLLELLRSSVCVSKNFLISREQCFDLNQLAAKAWVTKGYVFKH